MRNLYAILTILIYSVALSAQSGAGSEEPFKHTITFGGSLSLSSQKADDDNKSSSFFVNPYAMRRMDNNWQIGICAGYGRSISLSVRSTQPTQPISLSFSNRGSFNDFGRGIIFVNSPSSNEIRGTVQGLNACLFGRYTINPDEALSIFAEPGLSYNRSAFDVKVSNGNGLSATIQEGYGRTVSLGSRLGLAYGINENWRLVLFGGYLGYDHFSEKEEENDRFERTNTGFSLDLSLRSFQLAVEFSL